MSRLPMTLRAMFACAMLGTFVGQSLAADPKWEPTWADEFDGAAIDAKKWKLLTWDRPYNNERQAYLPEQAQVADGQLVITALAEPHAGQAFRSARLESHFSQQYGRWEIRAQLPGTRGTWPAIWLLPDAELHPWPTQGEIDILENGGHEPTVASSAFHFGKDFASHRYLTQRHAPPTGGTPPNLHTQPHVYAVEWSPTELRFFIDDRQVYTIRDAEVDGFLRHQSAPMQTVLNLAVGGEFLGDQQPDATSKWPQRMLVDYVRVYRDAASEK